jgi:rSAM/selenodomain-associated transferase 1
VNPVVKTQHDISMQLNPQKIARSHGDTDCMLVIMAKAPRPGMVKTRLAECLPPDAVLDFYRCLLADTLELAKSVQGVELAIMCPSSDLDELLRITGDGVRVVEQTGIGLAAGLNSVFAHFTAGCSRRVVAFNSDSPHLPASSLHSAFEVLQSSDIVIGPTHDGGYYLVGAKSSHPTLFDGDGMGTRSALDTLLARTTALGLSTGFTEPFYDIDLADDLIRLAQELRLAPEKAPRTAAWVADREQVIAPLRTRIGDL